MMDDMGEAYAAQTQLADQRYLFDCPDRGSDHRSTSCRSTGTFAPLRAVLMDGGHYYGEEGSGRLPPIKLGWRHVVAGIVAIVVVAASFVAIAAGAFAPLWQG